MNTMSNDDRLLTVKQAAAALAVSARLVWQLRASGKLPAVRIHRAVRFRASDLQNLIREGVN